MALMAYEIQPRYQCINCLKARDAEISANGSSSIPYQFTAANASSHVLANLTHAVMQVIVAVSVP